MKKQYVLIITVILCLVLTSSMSLAKDSDAETIEACEQAAKKNPDDAQAHFNLLLGLLMAGRKGIREQFEKVMGKSSKQDLELAIANLKDALERKPEFMEAAKLLNWIESRI